MRGHGSSLTRQSAGYGFTLVELLVVIAILAVLAALLFPVFARAKDAAKGATCLSNHRQLGIAMLLYNGDNDGRFVQTKPSSGRPEVDDRAGALEEPDSGPVWPRLAPYARGGTLRLYCPVDVDPSGRQCQDIDPDAPELTSTLVNASLVFGISESGLPKPAETVMLAERRSEGPYCDYLYRPWYSAENPEAPEDQMDALVGAIATRRHSERATYGFADGHAKNLSWSQTYAPASGLDLHSIGR